VVQHTRRKYVVERSERANEAENDQRLPNSVSQKRPRSRLELTTYLRIYAHRVWTIVIRSVSVFEDHDS
jgi:hypothetical protein